MVAEGSCSTEVGLDGEGRWGEVSRTRGFVSICGVGLPAMGRAGEEHAASRKANGMLRKRISIQYASIWHQAAAAQRPRATPRPSRHLRRTAGAVRTSGRCAGLARVRPGGSGWPASFYGDLAGISQLRFRPPAGSASTSEWAHRRLRLECYFTSSSFTPLPARRLFRAAATRARKRGSFSRR